MTDREFRICILEKIREETEKHIKSCQFLGKGLDAILKRLTLLDEHDESFLCIHYHKDIDNGVIPSDTGVALPDAVLWQAEVIDGVHGSRFGLLAEVSVYNNCICAVSRTLGHWWLNKGLVTSMEHWKPDTRLNNHWPAQASCAVDINDLDSVDKIIHAIKELIDLWGRVQA